ncbi:MAG: fumarylacetoacetate hydrolase family protein [Pirellulaceae bacterium]|nr:fumarylacetoacetate hydrolase family protein [Pirellulaceae bacterium]
MRLCRFQQPQQAPAIGVYDESGIIPLSVLAEIYERQTSDAIQLPAGDNLLDYLPAGGQAFDVARRMHQWLTAHRGQVPASQILPTGKTQLLVPIPRPNKLFLLAGNYAQHIEEGGGKAAERAETFPYVFMKPPTTTLTNPGQPVRIPKVSPHSVDWELELAVVIGRGGKHIPEAKALEHVAGYTVINDISDRKFRPNANRKPRDKDSFFDWLHGKWHDSFCPCGPCITSADAIDDPQSLQMLLKLNGQVRQDASTAQQIFPVAAVIEFLSSFVTLEPGDIISTGTPAGVGNTTQTYLKAGDRLEASISSIGTLVSPVELE